MNRGLAWCDGSTECASRDGHRSRGSVFDGEGAFMTTARFTTQEVRQVAEALSLDFLKERFDIEQFRMDMDDGQDRAGQPS
jgi:hypothetical protein